MVAPSAALLARSYPERDDRPPGKLERLANELRYLFGRPESGARALGEIVGAVNASDLSAVAVDRSVT